MVKNKKVYLSIICLLTCLISSLSGCVVSDDVEFVFDNKYNAEIYNIGEAGSKDSFKSTHLFTEKFWIESRTLGCMYKNEDYTSGDPEWMEYVEDTTSPKSRTYIISNRQECDGTFAEDALWDYTKLDYEKYMLVVYISKGFYDKGTVLKSVEVQDKHLTIECVVKKEKKSSSLFNKQSNNTTAPLRIWIIVKMDKVYVDTAEITLRNL